MKIIYNSTFIIIFIIFTIYILKDNDKYKIIPKEHIIKRVNIPNYKPRVKSNNFKWLFKTINNEYENVKLTKVNNKYSNIPKWIKGSYLKTGFCGYEQPSPDGKPNENPSYKFNMLFDTLGK